MNKYLKSLSNPTKSLIIFVIFAILVILRVYIESAILGSFFNYYVVFHHLFWFTSVLLWNLICFRHIVKMETGKLVYLPLAVIIVYIPMIYAQIEAGAAQLVYIKSRNPGDIFSYIITLMYTHPKNSYMFPELLILLAGTTFLSWKASKSIPKTFINTFAAFYCSMIFGFHWFGRLYDKNPYINLKTEFHNHVILSLVYYSISLMLLIFLFLPELKKMGREIFSPLVSGVTFSVSALILLLLNIFMHRNTFIDLLFIFISIFASFFFLTLCFRKKIPTGFKILALIYSISAFMMFLFPTIVILNHRFSS